LSGDLHSVWGRNWEEVWLPLSRSKAAPNDFFIEMVIGTSPVPRPPRALAPFPEKAFDDDGNLSDPVALAARDKYEASLKMHLADRDAYETALSSAVSAEEYFWNFHRGVSDEISSIDFLQESYSVIKALDDDQLTSEYVSLIKSFVSNYNLRYEVRGKFALCPTIPGVFSKMMSETKRITLDDPHLDLLMLEFEEAFSDLTVDRSQAKIKTCLQKQFNLLEAMGRNCPRVTATTFGAICGQLDWPHVTVKDVGLKLYGFRSDYPGLGHGGNPEGMLRQLEMKDFISLSLILASLTPYFAHNLDSQVCYGVIR